MQSEVSCNSGDRGLSLVSMVFPAVGGKPKPAVELSGKGFDKADARVVLQEYAGRLQRPEGEKKVSDCYFPTVC